MPLVKAYVQFDGRDCLDPRALKGQLDRIGLTSDKFWGRANAFFLPRGRQPGRGFFLLLKSDYDDIIEEDAATHVATFYEGIASIPISNLYILGKYSICGSQVESDNDVVMIEVADARILAPLNHANDNVNLRSPDYENYFDETVTGSFSTIVSGLYAEVPPVFSGLTTTDADFPAGVPEGYCFHGVTYWDAIFQILNDTNHFGYCSRSGQFVISANNAADTATTTLISDNVRELLHHSHASTPLPLPETIRVLFPKRDFAFQNSLDDFQVTFNDFWRNHPFDYRDILTTSIDSSASVIAGTYQVLYDSLPALYDRLGVNTNDSALDTRALERATLYVEGEQLTERYAHQVYSGLIGFAPSSRVSAVAWMDIGDGIKTELFLLPSENYAGPDTILNFASLFSTSDLVTARDFAQFSSSEYPGPPDLSRDHIPFERWAVVQLIDNISPLDDGTAYVRYANNSLLFGNSTKIITVQDIYGFTYPAGSVVLAMFHGQSRSWVIVCGNSNWQLYRFELYEDLELGGEASARVVIWNGLDYAAVPALAITVRDFTQDPGSWSGKAGYQGWCVYAADSEVFEIIWMELQARHIQFELVEKIELGISEGAEVTYWWDIKDPGANVDVVDRIGWWELAPEGARGHAVWDEKEQEYVIIWVEHLAEGIAFSTVEDWVAPGGKFKANVTDYWRGLDPTDANGQVDLIDPASVFEGIVLGTVGYATYYKEENAYVPLICRLHQLAIFGTLNSALLTTDATVAGEVTSIASQQPYLDGPAVGDDVTLANVFGFEADNGAVFYAVWDNGWKIVQIACPN